VAGWGRGEERTTDVIILVELSLWSLPHVVRTQAQAKLNLGQEANNWRNQQVETWRIVRGRMGSRGSDMPVSGNQ